MAGRSGAYVGELVSDGDKRQFADECKECTRLLARRKKVI